jgi:hypothetical protein
LRNCKGQTSQKDPTWLFQGKKTVSFLFEEINALKKQLKSEMEENPKRGRPNPHSQLKLN